MLGLKVVKSASLGQPAEWEDEGEAGDPAEAAADASDSPSERVRRSALALRLVGSGAITAKTAPWGR